MTPGQTVPQGAPGEEEEEEEEEDGGGEPEHCLASVRPHGLTVTRPTVRYQLSGEQC